LDSEPQSFIGEPQTIKPEPQSFIGEPQTIKLEPQTIKPEPQSFTMFEICDFFEKSQI
jgi:hypothetical protein